MNRLQQMKMLFKSFVCLSVAFLLGWCVILHRNNKRLTESLQMAQNNIESYQNILNGVNDKNNTLELTVEQLKNSNDSLLVNLTKKAKENNIKINEVNTIATQTQTIYVSNSKGVRGNILDILNSDSTYTDSIQYNDDTAVYFDINKDSINVSLDIKNSQYLYTYKHKEYKNKKNFFQRLFTFDFKKVYKYRYEIINTNDLINTSDVRVVEITED